MPRALVTTLCDDVREELRGKHSVMGIFNRFIVSDFRNPVNTFWIYARIELEQDGEYEFAFRFRTIEGENIFQVNAHLTTQSEGQIPPATDLKIRIDGLRFPRHGVYELALLHHDQVLSTVPIEVVVPSPRYIQ
jgi:hypothetical protein